MEVVCLSTNNSVQFELCFVLIFVPDVLYVGRWSINFIGWRLLYFEHTFIPEILMLGHESLRPNETSLGHIMPNIMNFVRWSTCYFVMNCVIFVPDLLQIGLCSSNIFGLRDSYHETIFVSCVLFGY